MGASSAEQLSSRLAKLTVAELKALMKKYRLSADNCFEKPDLVAKICEAHTAHVAKQDAERRERGMPPSPSPSALCRCV